MGPECGSAPDDPLWTDQFWSVNGGDQFDTAQAYPDVIAAANKFLAERIIFETKAAQKKTTITCVKGKTVKRVTALKPVCPAGYKKK
jgi:hypothetical protein